MYSMGNTKDITIPDGDDELVIGYIEKGKCDHCGDFWYAYAFRDRAELTDYQLGTYDDEEDAEAAVRKEYERLGPFEEDEGE